MQVSSPVTAAGPCRFCTGFPLMPYMGTRIILTTTYRTSLNLSRKNCPGLPGRGGAVFSGPLAANQADHSRGAGRRGSGYTLSPWLPSPI